MRPIVKTHAEKTVQRADAAAYIERAISLGAQIVELDIQVTGDGVPVVFHDDRIGAVPVAGEELEALRRLEPGLETLSDALLLFGGSRVLINLDLKSASFCPAVYRALEERRLLSRAVISGMQFWDVPLARKWFAPEQIWVSTEFREEGIEPDEWDEYISENLAKARETDCRNLNCYLRNVSRDFVREAHRQGFLVHVWTANRESEMRDLIDWGADSIATDRLPLLLRMLREQMTLFS